MRISPEGKISLEDHADTVGLVGMITSFRSPTRSGSLQIGSRKATDRRVSVGRGNVGCCV
jgi:hypothetical protein